MTASPPQLNDPAIRDALICALRKRSTNDLLLLEELRAHNGNVIVDVAAVSRQQIHAYEIKGATDKVARLARQAEFYESCFLRNTLVTTINHLSWARSNLAPHWGLIVATAEFSNGIRLRRIRAAGRSPSYAPKKALLMLWRSELITLATKTPGASPKSKDSRRALAERIGGLLSPTKASALITQAIKLRNLGEDFHHIGDM